MLVSKGSFGSAKKTTDVPTKIIIPHTTCLQSLVHDNFGVFALDCARAGCMVLGRKF